MNIQTKDFPVTGFDATPEFPNGSFEVILSAPTLDRDGEIVDAKAFEPLPDHISFDTDHSMTCESVVGSGTPYYAEDGTLRVKGGYCSDPASQTIRTKVAEGHIRTTSVTFMAAKRTKDDKGIPHVTSAELLNGTFTPIPSNRESVVLAAKSILLGNVKAGARNSAKDAELIQAAHDGMAALGADCPTPADDDPASGGKTKKPDGIKSLVGSVEALQDRVSDALEDAYGSDDDWSWWGYLRGVVPTDATSGYCVFMLAGEDDPYQQNYTDDGAVTTLVGDATSIEIHEVIAPDADAFREEDDTTLTPTGRSAATDPAAAKAAAGSAAADEVPEEVKAAIAARRNQIQAASL